MMGNCYWDSDDFESYVNAGLVSLLEANTLPKKKITKHGKMYQMPKNRIFSENDFLSLKNTGIYFCPGDREMLDNMIWLDIDSPPKAASFSFGPSHALELRTIDVATSYPRDVYLETLFAQQIKDFPRGVVAIGEAKFKYKLSTVYSSESKGVSGWSYYFSISSKGMIYPCKSGDLSENTLELVSAYAATVIGLWIDKKNIWNVSSEGVTLGVYDSQIKSLLYARSLPLTETGRKRPILHWVASHKRRLKEGVDIDINRHLRGVDRFEMFGHQFNISNPLKG